MIEYYFDNSKLEKTVVKIETKSFDELINELISMNMALINRSVLQKFSLQEEQEHIANEIKNLLGNFLIESSTNIQSFREI